MLDYIFRKNNVDAAKFLLDNDAEVNPKYPGGNS